MIIWKVRIHDCLSQRFEDIGDILTMVNETSSSGRGNSLVISREAGGGVHEGSSFPGIVWCWGREDDFCAFGQHELRCGRHVGGEGLDD